MAAALDGTLYVSVRSGGASYGPIYVFATSAAAGGTLPAARSIGGPTLETTFSYPSVALDAAEDVVVASIDPSTSGGRIDVFAPGGSTPSRSMILPRGGRISIGP
jgi:hypothetical protein